MEEVNFITEFEKVEEKYNNYIKKNYDFRKTSIKHKFEHTGRVVKLSERITRELDLNQEDIFTAKIIALFHDIGHFEIIKNEESKKIDHGKLGVDLLFKTDLIRDFIEETKYDNIIREAIFNHNKFEIETKRLSEHELTHVKILRDADKTDAFFNKSNSDVEKTMPYSLNEIAESDISEEVYEEFMDEKTILREIVKTPADDWMCNVAYVFGYYFTSGLKILYENNYLNIIKDKIEFKNDETKSKIKNMFKLAENHISYRILNNINF